jgi:hypothetical protein
MRTWESIDGLSALWPCAARRSAALREAEEIDRTVEAALEQLEKAFAGDAAFLLGVFEHAAELAFEQDVDVTELLLFVEAYGVLRNLAAELWTVLAGGITAALERLGRAEKLLAEATADAGGRSGITSHVGLF